MENNKLGLPGGPSEGEAKISYASKNVEGMELESNRGEHEIGLKSGDDGSYQIEMILPNASESEYITRGVDTVEAWEKMVRAEFYGEGSGSSYDWILESGEEYEFEERDSVDVKTARDVLSPSYEDMDELREETAERLEQVGTEAEERQVLEDAWEEAAEIDLEGANRKF